jgi:hypothetical protein
LLVVLDDRVRGLCLHTSIGECVAQLVVGDERTPPASSIWACAATLSGTSGFASMPDKNELVSAEIRTAPARAARSSVIESGRIRTPVSTADSSWPLFDEQGPVR